MTDGPFGRQQGGGSDPPPSGENLPPQGGDEPTPGRPRPTGRRGPSGQTWIVAILLAIIIVYVTTNTLTTEGPGSRGVSEGTEVPPFAAPLALANLRCNGGEECDANVLLKESDGVPKACDTRGPDIVNSCELAEEGPFVLAFLVEPSEDCADQIDLLEEIRPRFEDEIAFAAVAIRGDHAELNDLIRKRGWELPVAYDHDGAIANAFAVAVCPTITFVDQGGVVNATTLGTASEEEIVREIKALLA